MSHGTMRSGLARRPVGVLQAHSAAPSASASIGLPLGQTAVGAFRRAHGAAGRWIRDPRRARPPRAPRPKTRSPTSSLCAAPARAGGVTTRRTTTLTSIVRQLCQPPADSPVPATRRGRRHRPLGLHRGRGAGRARFTTSCPETITPSVDSRLMQQGAQDFSRQVASATSTTVRQSRRTATGSNAEPVASALAR